MKPERDSPIRLAVALPSLAGDGGAERVMLTILRHLDRARIKPELIVLNATDAQIRALVPADVPVHVLGVKRVRYAAPGLISLLRRNPPDALLVGLGHLNLMVAIFAPLLPGKIALLSRETNVVTQINAEENFTWLRNGLYRKFYPAMHRVVCQSQDMFDDLTRELNFPPSRSVVIHNPVDTKTIEQLAQVSPLVEIDGWTGQKTLKLVAVGRLSPQKGFDILLDAIALLARPQVHLVIIGQGPLAENLRQQVSRLRIDRQVTMLGYQENPYPYLKQADAMVLSSRYEGLPNVVLESLACGTPVIATPALGGLREIAAIAPAVRLSASITADSLAHAIDAFCEMAEVGTQINARAFSLDATLPKYTQLIEDAVDDIRRERSLRDQDRSRS